MRMRRNYWKLSSFSKWLRSLVGVESPHSLTAHGWVKWRSDYVASHPVMYYITEVMFNKIQNVLSYPIDMYNNFKIYVRNRFIEKSHYLHTNLKIGQYHEIDKRILHGLFETLVEFVEIEKAHVQWSWVEDNKDKFNKKKYGRELGLKYLYWEVNTEHGTSNDQAVTAQEVISLYLWWKDIRPSRLDPMDVSGYNSIISKDDMTDIMQILATPQTPEMSKASEITREIEESYDTEDEEMMIRLIKVRHSLWT